MATAASVIPTYLTRVATNTDGESYATGSIAPTNGRPCLVAVASYRAAGDPAIPTLAGNGQTWTQVATEVIGSNLRITLFSAPGASPSAGAITATTTGETQLAWAIWVVEFENASTTDFVVQTKNVNTVASASTLPVTLDNPLTAAFNICVAFYAMQVNVTLNPGAGMAQNNTSQGVSDGLCHGMIFSTALTLNVTFTTGTVSRVGIAAEIKHNGTGAGGMIMARKQGGF